MGNATGRLDTEEVECLIHISPYDHSSLPPHIFGSGHKNAAHIFRENKLKVHIYGWHGPGGDGEQAQLYIYSVSLTIN